MSDRILFNRGPFLAKLDTPDLKGFILITQCLNDINVQPVSDSIFYFNFLRD